jgi:hypothetical protein
MLAPKQELKKILMKKTKLYAVYTDEIIEIKDIFLSSIKDDWDINLEYLESPGEGDGDFATKGWYYVMRKRIEFLIERIKENWGDIIIWSDVDIYFYAQCSSMIDQAIADKDIVFQSEWWPVKEVNCGFSVIRCNDKTLSLYQLILESDLEKMSHGDQSAMNKILKEKIIDIEWDILPRQFWATSHYGYDSSLPPNDIVLHHSNCTAPIIRDGNKIGSVQLKLEQFKIIGDYVASQSGRD